MTSLYRKWRSGSFDDLVGQEHVVRTLRNAVRTNRVAHAYLFTGPRGTGKTSTARILAKAVNCLHPVDGSPDNTCEACRAANEGRALDVIEIDAASNTSVENVRDLRERVAYAAGEGRYKVYIVDEVHRLSGAAFDAFLKTLEEPPPHVIFVFASTEPHKVPATIASRCQRFDFRRIGIAETVGRLQTVAREEGVRVTDGALLLIAQNANGSLRDALGLLEQVSAYAEGGVDDETVRAALGIADPLLVVRLTDHLLDGEIGKGLAEGGRFVDGGGEPAQLSGQLIQYWRALLLESTGAGRGDLVVDPVLGPELARHARSLKAEHIVAVLRVWTEPDFSPKYDVAPSLPFEIGYVGSALALQGVAARPQIRPQKQQEGRPQAPPPPTPPQEEPVGTSRPDNIRTMPQPRSDGQASVPPPAAEPAAVQPPAPTPELQPGTVSGDIESAWPEVVARMRARSGSLQALLRSGHVINVADGTVTVGFLHGFHCDQFADTKKRRVVEEVIAEVVGTPYRMSVVRTTREQVEAVRGAGAVEEDDGFMDEAGDRLRTFHARQLGNGHS